MIFIVDTDLPDPTWPILWVIFDREADVSLATSWSTYGWTDWLEWDADGW